MQEVVMKKTISFGILHMTIAFTVAYAMTGSLLVGGAIALVEPAVNTVAYFFHEKFWESKTGFGKHRFAAMKARFENVLIQVFASSAR